MALRSHQRGAGHVLQDLPAQHEVDRRVFANRAGLGEGGLGDLHVDEGPEADVKPAGDGIVGDLRGGEPGFARTQFLDGRSIVVTRLPNVAKHLETDVIGGQCALACRDPRPLNLKGCFEAIENGPRDPQRNDAEPLMVQLIDERPLRDGEQIGAGLAYQ